MTGGELSAEERADLRYEAGIVLAEGPEYDDDGIPSGDFVVADGLVRALDALAAAEAQVAAVEAERDEVQASLDHWQHSAKIEAARLREQRDRAEAAEAEVARLAAEVKHWKDHAQEAGEGFTQVCRDAARISARNVELSAQREAGLALADHWVNPACDTPSMCAHVRCGHGRRLRAVLGGTE